ncbi:hypothetical protein K4F52_008747 [Lecanicillium sp. MT-2017a]|nr:hypothetical protein K4F52_008747 [Lecanicillium sp. MT-2017a]
MSLDPEIRHDTSALPGGHKELGGATWGRHHWRQLVDMELPDDATLTSLVNKFFLSVDWFMMVFHEPSFRERYEALLRSEHVLYREGNFLWLAMLVVALGAHYTAVSSSVVASEFDLQRLSSDLIARIEARFLQFVGCASVETVQICVLLGSFLLFNGRPNVGLGISGAGVKIAQVINLHRENRWQDTSADIMETKRRTWWALEVFDK